MNARFRRSTGQGSLHSKMSTAISSDNSSIVSRLFSRSVTGQNLNIQIHQHFAKSIHLIWKTHDKDPNNPSERCMERFFLLYEELENFCGELKYGALEGLCDCVFPGLYRLLGTKVTICFRRPVLQTERDFPRCWLKCYQEFSQHSPCECPVSSSELLQWKWKCSSTCVHAIHPPPDNYLAFVGLSEPELLGAMGL